MTLLWTDETERILALSNDEAEQELADLLEYGQSAHRKEHV